MIPVSCPGIIWFLNVMLGSVRHQNFELSCRLVCATGILLFPIQDDVAFLLCSTDGSVHTESDEPVLLWTAGTVLC